MKPRISKKSGIWKCEFDGYDMSIYCPGVSLGEACDYFKRYGAR